MCDIWNGVEVPSLMCGLKATVWSRNEFDKLEIVPKKTINKYVAEGAWVYGMELLEREYTN